MSSPANQTAAKQEPQDREGQIATLGKLIKGVDIAMFTTEMPDGSLRSRPMATQNEDFDGTLWFLTDKTTPKIGEIEGHTQVNLSYANPSSSTYVSVSGRASIVADRDKIAQFWSEAHKVWFPDGPNDPDIVLIKVEVDQAEYWDNNQLVTLFGMAKGYVTGEGYQGEGAEHAKLSLSGQR